MINNDFKEQSKIYESLMELIKFENETKNITYILHILNKYK